MGIETSMGSVMQGRLNLELTAKEVATPAAPEKGCVKQAKQAEMKFRIAKGYEKDNLFTRIKYFFKGIF